MSAFDGGFRIAALGEVAIRCRDIEPMRRFYRDVIGLEPLAERGSGIVFFRIAEGHAGHTCVLALFDGAGASESAADADPRGIVTGPRSSLHHLALTLDLAAQERAIAWYERIGQPYRIETFDWIGWRGVFTTDPEGNTVELVAATGPERGEP